MPHTQYHPHDVPTPEPDDVDPDFPLAEQPDGLVPPEIADDPEHERLIDPQE